MDNLLKDLLECLSDSEYDLILKTASHKYFQNPWSNRNFIKNNIMRYQGDKYSLIRLFYLGESVNPDCIDDRVQNLTSGLVNMGFLERESKTRFLTSNYLIMPYYGKYMIIDYFPEKKRQFDIYLGDDSFDLVHYCSDLYGNKALDLCTGSGIQALFLTDRFNEVTGCDINSRVARLFDYNRKINNIENLRFINSNLFEVIEGSFDAIVMNPPFVALPEDIGLYPLAGYGGPLGTDTIEKAVKSLPEYLNTDGTFKSYFTLCDRESDLLLVPFLEEFFRDRDDFSITLTLASRFHKENFARGYSRALSIIYNKDEEALYKKIINHYDQFRMDFVYTAFLKIKRSAGKKLNIIDLTSGLNIYKKIRFIKKFHIMPFSGDKSKLVFENGSHFILPEKLAVILKNFDENRSISENINDRSFTSDASEFIGFLEHWFINGLIHQS